MVQQPFPPAPREGLELEMCGYGQFGGRLNIAHGHIVEVMEPDFIRPTQDKASVIYVDVDDTLVRSFGTKQIPMAQSVQYVRAMFEAGHLLYCWSRGGAEYARNIAIKLGIEECFVCFLPKPDIVLDDRLEHHLAHCQFVHPNNAVPSRKATNNLTNPSSET